MKMKVEMNIEGEPEELRTFFGLPSLQAFQQELLAQMREKMLAGAEGFDPLSLMKPYLPESLRAFETLQKSFWQGVADATTGTSQKTGKTEKKSEDKK